MSKYTANHATDAPDNKSGNTPEILSENNPEKKDLLSHSAIWCASELAASEPIHKVFGQRSLTGTQPSGASSSGADSSGINASGINFSGINTGFDCFNQQLADGGWPQQGVTEILYERPGTGELSIILPLLRHFSQDERWLIWVAPPFQLHAPALQQSGVSHRQILQVAPQSAKDRLWCTEEALKSAAVSLVLSWPGHLKPEHVRRLQIIANQHRVPCVLFREQGTMNTPCALRVHIRNIDQNYAQVHILKRRRGWSPPPFTLRLRNCPEHRYQNQQADHTKAARLFRSNPTAQPNHSSTMLPTKNKAVG